MMQRSARRRIVGWVGATLCTLGAPALAVPPVPAPAFFLSNTGGNHAAARDAVEEGQRLLARYEFDRAAQSFHRGVESLLASATPADDELLATALVELAVAQTRSGQRDRARETLMELGRLCPQHIVEGAMYPSVFLREVEEARLKVEQGPRATLALVGPEGARVEVDGRGMGALPTQVSLPVGRHRVTIGNQQRLVALGARGGALDLSTPRPAAPPLAAAPAGEAPGSDLDWGRPSLEPESNRGTRTLPGIEAVTASRPAEARVREGPPWWVWPLVGVGLAAAAGGTLLGVQGTMNQVPAQGPGPGTP